MAVVCCGSDDGGGNRYQADTVVYACPVRCGTSFKTTFFGVCQIDFLSEFDIAI